ncbi:hypothetical protein ACJ41O_012707 [Fusarium nematophilum]
MPKLVDDVKSGLKGIRGAGDALRGEAMEATNNAFERDPNHPASLESRKENRAISEKGKHDMRGADEMFARHEWKRKGADPPADVAGERRDVPAEEGIPENTPSRATEQYGAERPTETLTREPAANIPGDIERYGTERSAEPVGRETGANVPEKAARYETERLSESLQSEAGANISGETRQDRASRLDESLAREPRTRAPGGQHYI